jgi:putative iron-dependent peroxidase
MFDDIRSQKGILLPVSPHARYLEFDIDQSQGLSAALSKLGAIQLEDTYIIGFSSLLVESYGKNVAGLRVYPDFGNPEIVIPSSQAALWVCIRGQDRGRIAIQSWELVDLLKPVFKLARLVDGFTYDTGRDLTGYEDGTENPVGQDAVNAAIVQNSSSGMDGSSYVAVQQWLHDFDAFYAMSVAEQDDIIGRHRSNNEEFDAPDSAHVKRTAQESFSPEAFIVRRSLPWSNKDGNGLMFIAFGSSFDAFESQMNRMIGLDDTIYDGLFSFTRPITGGYYWCPPVNRGGCLDLSVLETD